MAESTISKAAAILVAVCLCASLGPVHAQSIYQPYTFTTLAGGGGSGAADGIGGAARFNQPFGAAADSAGNIYVADTGNSTIRKITSAGEVTTLAGLAGSSGSADGTGSTARFNQPYATAIDTGGNAYVADTYNHTIRKITPTGVVTTLAGLAGNPGSTDGTAGAARFFYPSGVATDASGNIYVADYGTSTVRKITSAGVVTTLAGLAGNSGSADGTGSAARFNAPQGIATDTFGNVYVSDTGNNTIRKITAGGVVTTLAGLAGSSGSADGTGSAARFHRPTSAATDISGNIYVADFSNHTLRKVTLAGVVTTLAGLAGSSGSSDGTGNAARFYNPTGVATDSAGNVHVVDRQNHTIRKVTPAGVVTTLAGLPVSTGSADGTGSAARFRQPYSVATDTSNNVYVADAYNHTIRKVSPAGVVTTVAGLAGSIGSIDGTGGAARFNSPRGIATDTSNNVYVADYYNSTIRKITPAGVVTTLAGLAGSNGSADGTGSAARFFYPYGIATDAAGNVYIADTGSSTVRKITPGSVVTTLAGLASYTGSADGSGSAARFNSPQGIGTDSVGNIYVADTGNRTIRKITAAGVVTTFAGLAGSSGSADGAGASARFSGPNGVATDSVGNVYVSDTGNHTIRKITPDGTVKTLAGLAGSFASDDGTGSAARFYYPVGLAIDTLGNILVGDTFNNGIRKGFIPDPRFTASYTPANGWFALQISYPTNHACLIETSTSLDNSANWLPIFTNTVPFWFTNFDASADVQRIHRASLAP